MRLSNEEYAARLLAVYFTDGVSLYISVGEFKRSIIFAREEGQREGRHDAFLPYTDVLPHWCRYQCDPRVAELEAKLAESERVVMKLGQQFAELNVKASESDRLYVEASRQLGHVRGLLRMFRAAAQRVNQEVALILMNSQGDGCDRTRP